MGEYDNVNWNHDPASMDLVMKSTQKLWAEHSLKAAMIRGKLKELEVCFGATLSSQAELLQARRKEKSYTKLMELPRCPSLEDKIKTIVKKRKIALPGEDDDLNICDDDNYDEV